MKRMVGFFATLAVPAVVLALAGPLDAGAQEKAKAVQKFEQKELLKNDKVNVVEARWPPGSESPSVARPYRVIRVLKGGTVQRIFPDGKKENVVYKAGEVSALEASQPYAIKNIGKSEVVLFAIFLK
jgi:hypothetical protein